MRIYTRYKSARRRPAWQGLLRILLIAASLGLVGFVLYRHLDPGHPAPLASHTPSTLVSNPVTVTRTVAPVAPVLPRAFPPTTNTVAPVSPPVTNRPSPALTPAVSVPAPTNAVPESPTPAPLIRTGFTPRPVENLLEAQIALARLGISSGSIDGTTGYQTRAAMRAFQAGSGLPTTGQLDESTRSRLRLEAPALTRYAVNSNDLARLLPVSSTWLGKSRQPRLDFASILELVSERHRAHPVLIRKLNPEVNWTNVHAGQVLTVPDADPGPLTARLAFIRIRLQDRVLAGYDVRTNLLLQFPCSIAARVEKRPLGRLEVVVLAQDPAYTFNPAVFPESAEGRRLGRKLTIPPGPNNPVGVAWIGLSRPGYGIHGTPRPEDVGRTESHGCFRLANWDAERLVQLAWRGLPVYVQH